MLQVKDNTIAIATRHTDRHVISKCGLVILKLELIKVVDVVTVMFSPKVPFLD